MQTSLNILLVKFHGNILKRACSALSSTVSLTVADWDSMGRVITQARGRAFQTLDRAFQTLDRTFTFLLNSQKLGRVFQKLGRVFQRLGCIF